jgi:hypothetical protein
MYLPRIELERLIYGGGTARRQTQDSPILPDVWLRFGAWGEHAKRTPDGEAVGDPNAAQQLLLTPYWGWTPGDVTRALREGLGDDARTARIAYNQTYVALRLNFRQVVRLVLPLTSWWFDRVLLNLARLPARGGGRIADGKTGKARNLGAFLRSHERLLVADLRSQAGEGEKAPPIVPPDLVSMIWLVGSIAHALEAPPRGKAAEAAFTAQQVFDAIVELFEGVQVTLPGNDFNREKRKPLVYLVNLNRPAELAITRSTLAVKADAARRLFELGCSKIAWGVIDSGIDASHPAFLDVRSLDDPKKDPRDDTGYKKQGKKPFPWWKHTRVRATYDFTRIRMLLDPDLLDPNTNDPALKAILERGNTEELEELRNRLKRGRSIDWALLEPFLRIPHDEKYPVPTSDHGTHVAGILGASWPQRKDFDGVPFTGVCPDIGLYDLRVIDPMAPESDDDEFAVLAALQFVAHLNNQNDFFAIPGVNVSLAIRHEVANYACGRTPVCDECERLVSSGVVVVAAAGNDGYLHYQTTRGERSGYHTVSITDPGNAEAVITAGSTHRFQPHTYGVSYFSSRGPTGDGRIKPDLVAPGEKILAPVAQRPGEDFWEVDFKDGTSMAAPHVSGAAALLMARHGELIGEPERIKKILCASATDLGRERYFQGAGMLDILRALQSV